jgi:hypothetical protein
MEVLNRFLVALCVLIAVVGSFFVDKSSLQLNLFDGDAYAALVRERTDAIQQIERSAGSSDADRLNAPLRERATALERQIGAIEAENRNRFYAFRALSLGALGALAAILSRLVMPWREEQIGGGMPHLSAGRTLAALAVGAVTAVIVFGAFLTGDVSLYAGAPVIDPDFWRMTIVCLLAGALSIFLHRAAEARFGRGGRTLAEPAGPLRVLPPPSPPPPAPKTPAPPAVSPRPGRPARVRPARAQPIRPARPQPAVRPVPSRPAARPVQSRPAARPVQPRPAARPVQSRPAVRPNQARPAPSKPAAPAPQPQAAPAGNAPPARPVRTVRTVRNARPAAAPAKATPPPAAATPAAPAPPAIPPNTPPPKKEP